MYRQIKLLTSTLKPSFLTKLYSMEKFKVVPDVIDSVPGDKLEVAYGSNVVDDGNELTPTEVKSSPKVKWAAQESTFYLLCMTDPDAPCRDAPKFREWHHWLVGNIPSNEIAKGDVLAEYIGAGPPKGTGLHRYVFVLYKQPKKITFEEKKLKNNSSKGRANFHIAKFAKKYNLGKPIAGNFFQAEWDSYVPTLYKQLGN